MFRGIKRIWGIFILLFVAVVLLLFLSYFFRTSKVVRIGSKNFTEQVIIAEIMAQTIEKFTDISVQRKLNLGGTMVCFRAIKEGQLDIYAEYTGTGYVNILKMEAVSDPDFVYKEVKKIFSEKFGIAWLEPFGFNNTYTLTMRREHADKLGIKNISDLERFKDVLLPGFDHEFFERPDGYPGLIKAYGFKFAKKPKEMDPGLMYKAIRDGSVDVIDAFATDARIKKFNLVVLKDDKNFFPPYYAAPIIREEIVDRYPAVVEALKKLSGKITDEKMTYMNYLVDMEGMNPMVVAENFIEQNL
jgi:glycine betaine/choline ABC-type transport system substrate-binding protein